MSIVTALAAINTVVSGVTGIIKADQPPAEQENEFPFAITYYARGNIEASPIGSKKNLFDVSIEVLTKKIKIQEDLALMNLFLDSVPTALVSEVSEGGDQFSNTIQTFDRVITEFLPSYDYAGVSMIGFRFTMQNVKILTSL